MKLPDKIVYPYGSIDINFDTPLAGCNVCSATLHQQTGARIYRASFHENKPKTIFFSHTKRAFWACFRENWVIISGTGSHKINWHHF
jgi:hypothetical protein